MAAASRLAIHPPFWDNRANDKARNLMAQIAIDYPDDLLVSLGTSADAFEKEARFALAAKLYEQGRLSSGKAAVIAGMDRVAFLVSLHQSGVAAIDLDEDEMQHEADFAGIE